MTVPLVIVDSLTPSIGKVTSFTPASGGCINNGGIVTTVGERYFLKWNESDAYPGMLETEARGLRILSHTNSLKVPEVIQHGNAGNFQYLLLQCITSSSRKSNFWHCFGEQLAAIHMTSSSSFGLDHDNYIGSLHQKNDYLSDWVKFYIERRLNPQIDLAKENNLMPFEMTKSFDSLFKKLPGMLPDEKPALLHGDLWGGNLMVDEHGHPCVIDPAVYFGNREVDLAMTQLFGGFDPKYLESYHAAFPLHSNYEERMLVYQLYPLMVHVNLFGGGYLSQVKSILDRFI